MHIISSVRQPSADNTALVQLERGYESCRDVTLSPSFERFFFPGARSLRWENEMRRLLQKTPFSPADVLMADALEEIPDRVGRRDGLRWCLIAPRLDTPGPGVTAVFGHAELYL